MTTFVDDPETQSMPARTTPWAGLAVLAAGIVAFACLSVGPHLGIGWHGDDDSVYTLSQWFLAASLCIAGLVAAVAPRPVSLLAWGGAAVFAAQLVGAGAVAYRHWVPWSGITDNRLTHPDTLRWVAIAMAVACFAGLLVCVRALVAGGAFGPAETRLLVVRILTLATGLVIIGLVPLALADGQPARLDWESLGAFSLLYGLPWGVSVAASAWLTRSSALGVHAAVLVSALVAIQTDGMMWMGDQPMAFGFCALAVASAAVARYSDHAK